MVLNRLRTLMGRKIAGVPLPILAVGLFIVAFIIYRRRKVEKKPQADATDYADTQEGPSDYSAGVGATRSAETFGDGGFSDYSGGGVIGLPPVTQDPYGQTTGFATIYPTGGRHHPRPGGRRRAGSFERYNRKEIQAIRHRTIERYRREQKEKRDYYTKRRARERAQRMEILDRIQNKVKAQGQNTIFGPPKPDEPRRREGIKRRALGTSRGTR